MSGFSVMKILPLLLGVVLIAPLRAEPFQQAEVTRVVNVVSLLRDQQKSRAAGVGDIVTGKTAVKTGADSRAELQFPDQTITRLGANAFFRFQAGGRSMDLEGGTMLFSSPKGAGGGQVQAGAVTAAVTGTDFLLSYQLNGEVKIIVLEGKVVVYLTQFPSVRRLLRTGQMVIVPKGATEIPTPHTIDLKRLLATSRLLEAGGFEPLFSNSLLQQAAQNQQRRIVRAPFFQNRDQQAAQITRRTLTGPPQAPPKPQAKPTPPPAPPPPPPPPPPKPAPTYTPHGH